MSRLHDVSLYAAIPYISGKGGTALASFVRIIQGIRSEVKNMDLPALIQTVLDKSGLLMYYQKEKDGTDRVENLGQLVSAATQFLSEEGFLLDAPALVVEQAHAQQTVDNPLLTVDRVIETDVPLTMIMSPLAAFL